MSKFIEKLNHASQAVTQPIGFRRIQPASPMPKMLLIARLEQARANELADYVAGADAGLLYISNLNSGASALHKICQIVSDIPWGGWLGGMSTVEIKQLAEAGCDFIVFPAANTYVTF